jgi:hypothetical protein
MRRPWLARSWQRMRLSALGWRITWNKGVPLLEQHHVPQEAALFVLSLVKAARRALLSAEGYQVERALAVLDQWMDDAAKRAAG